MTLSPETTAPTVASPDETIHVEAKLFDYLVEQELVQNGESVALVDGRLAISSDRVNWTYLKDAPELSRRAWLAGDWPLLVAVDGNVVHSSTDLTTWTTHTLDDYRGLRSIPAMGGRAPVFVNGASNQVLLLDVDSSIQPVPTEEDREVYERLLDIPDPRLICSVDVQYQAESTITFRNCAGEEITSWVEPRTLPQSVEFDVLAAAGVVQYGMTVIDLVTGDWQTEPVSMVNYREFVMPIEGGVIALNASWANPFGHDGDEREGSHFISTWTPESGWVAGQTVTALIPAGVNSPLQQRSDGAVILTTDSGPVKIVLG